MSRRTGFIKKHSTSIRSRHLQARDYVAEAIIGPRCVICVNYIPRTRYKSGIIAARTVWLKRRVCSHPTHPPKKSLCGRELVKRNLTKPETHKHCVFCQKRLGRSSRKERTIQGKHIFYCRDCMKKREIRKGVRQSIEHIKKRINNTCLTRYGHLWKIKEEK